MDKKQVYEKARLGASLGYGPSPAIVVIDLVRGFTNPEYPLGSDLSETIRETNRLIEQARTKKVPIVFTTIAYNPNLKDGGLWVKKAPAQGEFVFGSPLVAVDERMNFDAGTDTLLVKKYASAFFGTDLASQLTAQRIDTLIVCGATTSGCVRATVVDAMQNGFYPVVPKQAVGDRAAEPHAASLFDIQAKYGDVVDIDNTLSYLKTL